MISENVRSNIIYLYLYLYYILYYLYYIFIYNIIIVLQNPECRNSNFNTPNYDKNYTLNNVHFNHIEHINVNNDSQKC